MKRRSRRPAVPKKPFDWMDENVRLLLQSAPDPMVVVDHDGKIILANSQSQIAFGYAEQELIGEPMEILVPKRDHQVHKFHRADYLKHPRVQQMGAELELCGLRKNGSEFPIEIRLSPLRVEGALFVVAAIRDVSDRKKTEKELRRVSTELRAKVASLAGLNLGASEGGPPEHQLRQAQKMEAVGQLASGVAHDFNNILNVISGYADMLYERLPESEERKMAVEILTAVRRASVLTHQLLGFGRRQVRMPVVLNPNVVCDDIGGMLRRLIAEDIEVVTELYPAISPVEVDRGQLEQVLLNLGLNARDAMPRGGRLSIATRPVKLDENYVRSHATVVPGTYVEISVGDTGEGMDEHTKQHLFEPFFTTKEVGQGTGLGLATVYAIAEQSGGHVTVYSEVGHGSIFKIFLPTTGEPVVVPATEVVGKPVTGTETIVLVEDENQLRTVSKLFLETRGYRVLSASNGAAALDLLGGEVGSINLLITDVVMPGMNGRELAEAVAARRPGIKLLFMSGYTDDVMLRRGLERGKFPFIQKPFSLHDLSVKVREVLDG